MTKKVRNCIICGAPTLADNRLCKRIECHVERQKRRFILVPDTPPALDEETPPKSGSFMSLQNCTHGIPLERECLQCDDEWQNIINDIDTASDDLPSNPRIRLK